MALAAAAAAEAPLCDYELQRLERIKRNRKVMEALGLFDEDVALAAQMRAAAAAGGGSGGGGKGGGKTSRKRAADASPAEPQRRSQRVAGVASDGASLGEWPRGPTVRLPPDTLDGIHADEAERHDRRNAGAQRRASVVGTASYRHTLMRVRTMSEVALANRVRAIERAKGKHAVVKMRLFARVLFLEGYEELADEATEALQRLVALLGDVVSDDEAEPEAQDTPPRPAVKRED